MTDHQQFFPISYAIVSSALVYKDQCSEGIKRNYAINIELTIDINWFTHLHLHWSHSNELVIVESL